MFIVSPCKHTHEGHFFTSVVIMFTVLSTLRGTVLLGKQSKVKGTLFILIICKVSKTFWLFDPWQTLQKPLFFMSQSSGSFWSTVILVLMESSLLCKNSQYQDWLPLKLTNFIWEAIIQAHSQIFTIDIGTPHFYWLIFHDFKFCSTPKTIPCTTIDLLRFQHTNQLYFVILPSPDAFFITSYSEEAAQFPIASIFSTINLNPAVQLLKQST